MLFTQVFQPFEKNSLLQMNTFPLMIQPFFNAALLLFLRQ